MKVKEYRVIKGLTQNELSNLLGITQQAYSRKERGERSFTIEEIKKLKQIFNISYEELFGEVN